MTRKIKMTGQTYGRLFILKEDGKDVLAGCACGKEGWYYRGNVLAGYTKSCGCLLRERASEANIRHGMTKTTTWVCWQAMKTRCNNPNKDMYKHYGGRGISYDLRWEVFENFLADMGEKPVGLELDRIDNNGDYCKENCRWITHRENCQNRYY